jgi:hypothetical protein
MTRTLDVTRCKHAPSGVIDSKVGSRDTARVGRSRDGALPRHSANQFSSPLDHLLYHSHRRVIFPE